jgi:hypothetical protein
VVWFQAPTNTRKHLPWRTQTTEISNQDVPQIVMFLWVTYAYIKLCKNPPMGTNHMGVCRSQSSIRALNKVALKTTQSKTKWKLAQESYCTSIIQFYPQWSVCSGTVNFAWNNKQKIIYAIKFLLWSDTPPAGS